MWSRRRLGGALAGAAALAVLGPGRGQAEDGPRVHQVAIRKFAFAPAKLTIRPGDAVEWTNHDLAPHTATAGDGSWDTGGLAKGEMRRLTFAGPGRAAYLCAFHPHMTGEITVTAGETPPS